MPEKRDLREQAIQMCARMYPGTDARHWSIKQCLDTILERGGYVPSRAELEEIRANELA